MANYDVVNRQWESLGSKQFNIDQKSSLGQQILDALSKYGPKVAQVFDLFFFCSN